MKRFIALPSAGRVCKLVYEIPIFRFISRRVRRLNFEDKTFRFDEGYCLKEAFKRH